MHQQQMRYINSNMSPECSFIGQHPNTTGQSKNRFMNPQNPKFDIISHHHYQLEKEQLLQQQRLNLLHEMYQNRNNPAFQTPQNQAQLYQQFMQIYDKNEYQDRILKNQLFGNMPVNPNTTNSLGWNPQELHMMNSTTPIQHLFDQFGNHSHQCKCLKLRVQEFIAKQQTEKKQESGKTATPIAQKKKPKVPPPPLTRMETINQFIQKLNQLILITLKATDSINPLAMGQIKKLGQEIGIKWQTYLDAKFIKSKDFVTFLKSKIYVLLNGLLMRNNITLFDQVQLMSQE